LVPGTDVELDADVRDWPVGVRGGLEIGLSSGVGFG
jgi:hypothetical protein